MTPTLLMTNDRQNVIDYIDPCYSEYFTFTSPMPTITHFDNLLQPFDSYIWILIIITLLILGLIICNTNNKMARTFNLCWYILSILLRQNGTTRLTQINKLLMCTWMLMVMILGACYSGCIYSLIRVPIEHKIETLDQLIAHEMNGNIKIVVENGSIYQYVIVS